MKGLILTYALTYGGALIALGNPFAGFLIYVCFAIIKPDMLWDYSVPAGNYSRIIFAGLFIGWLIRGRGDWRFGLAWPSVLAVVFYVGWSSLSAIAAPDQTLAWQEVGERAKIVVAIILGLSLLNTKAHLRQLAWVIVVSQGYLAWEFNRSYYEGFNRVVKLGFAGMDEKSVAITMIVGAGVALFLGLNEKRLAFKAVAFSLSALMLHVPMFTLSRGSMMGLLAMGALAVWLTPKRPVHILVVACAIALGVRLAGAEVRAFFLTSFAEETARDYSAQSRIELWGQARETMMQHPILGVGPRHWGAWSQSAYRWENAKEVHNTWLQTGAELGVLGVISLGGFFIVTAGLLLPIARGRKSAAAEDAAFARMVVCGLGGFFVASQFITVYGLEVSYHVAILGAGVLKLRSRPDTPTSDFVAREDSVVRSGQTPPANAIVQRPEQRSDPVVQRPVTPRFLTRVNRSSASHNAWTLRGRRQRLL